jgi:hypothetical protein
MTPYQDRKYYALRHTYGDNVVYWTATNAWSSDFMNAVFFKSEKDVLKKRKLFIKSTVPTDKVVIGSVLVEVDPFFEMKLVELV